MSSTKQRYRAEILACNGSVSMPFHFPKATDNSGHVDLIMTIMYIRRLARFPGNKRVDHCCERFSWWETPCFNVRSSKGYIWRWGHATVRGVMGERSDDALGGRLIELAFCWCFL